MSHWDEFKRGWRDAAWSWRFSLWLLPGVMAAVTLASLIEGKVSDPPSLLTWVFVAPATLFAFWRAGIADGPDGYIGQWVYPVRDWWRGRRGRR